MKKLKAMAIAVLNAGMVGSFSFADGTAVNAGKKIFDSACATCHKADGKGNPSMAKVFKADLSLMDLTGGSIVKSPDEELLKIISDGRNKMPAFSKRFKADELKIVLQYVRGLAAKAKEGKPAKK